MSKFNISQFRKDFYMYLLCTKNNANTVIRQLDEVDDKKLSSLIENKDRTFLNDMYKSNYNKAALSLKYKVSEHKIENMTKAAFEHVYINFIGGYEMDIEQLKKNVLFEVYDKGVYTSLNEKGETLVITVSNKHNFSVRTNQKNGWVRINGYYYDPDKDDWDMDETYDK